ncbi:MAG TPA: hypothetical protein VKT53_16955 [Candidatus Acidoferrum sp.]|nr:hypothetical protein [Candidatus Acidoferrum sp.]
MNGTPEHGPNFPRIEYAFSLDPFQRLICFHKQDPSLIGPGICIHFAGRQALLDFISVRFGRKNQRAFLFSESAGEVFSNFQGWKLVRRIKIQTVLHLGLSARQR